MKRFLCLSVFVALTLTGNATFAADECTKIAATGHPQYPAIAFKDGDNIVGAAPTLVETIAKKLNVPLESKYMGTWEEAQAAARDGKADMIFGIYYNDERADLSRLMSSRPSPSMTSRSSSSRARISRSPTRTISSAKKASPIKARATVPTSTPS